MTRFWRTKEGKRILYVAAVVLIIVVGRIVFLESNKKEDVKNIENANRSVDVVRVFDISGDRLPLPLIGNVESKSEAVLRSEASGEISRLNKDIGDRVYAGEIIAEVSNASQRAEVLRAQGVLQSAQAGLLKVRGSSNDNVSLIKESVRSAFTTADDSVRNKVDQFIDDPDGVRPDIVSAGSDYNVRARAEGTRVELQKVFSDWSATMASIETINSSEALLAYVLTAQSNLEKIRNFLDDIATVVSGYEPNENLPQSTIDKYRSDVSVARANVNNSLNNLISSYNSLRSQVDSNVVGEDILSAQAQVTQAEAGILSAQASLEKTIIRSPIAGEINQIDIRLGDFVNAFEEVAVVANNNALEITTFISEKDRSTVAVGSNVTIEGGIKGVITRIAPALDKNTGKIEVAIGVDDNVNLTNGQSVSLEVERLGSSNSGNSGVITIPISALKITSSANYVFTVSDSGNLISHEVAVGSIVGEKIIITDGLSPTMEIVLDARGLKEGESVTVNNR